MKNWSIETNMKSIIKFSLIIVVCLSIIGWLDEASARKLHKKSISVSLSKKYVFNHQKEKFKPIQSENKLEKALRLIKPHCDAQNAKMI